MKKRVLSFLMMMMAIMLGCGVSVAQDMMPQLTPLPEMSGLRTGTLPNGLTYYVLHNEEPKGRANFYIAQKVGSTLETPEQLGLAHFLEHMAFNGSKNYPGKAMLTYLQNKGIRFGMDVNAYTSFDKTVYNIDNIPTNDQNLMDSVLLVLHDWSCDLLLEDEEIEAERGVIHEEWRRSNNVQTRMFTQMLPAIYDEYQYHQMPIGTMDVVLNFKPEVLRDYYHKWYRPDQQGIIVVGDFDAEAMEKKIIEMFSPIQMPENAPERVYAEVSDNKELIYFEFEDPEMTSAMIRTVFKSDPVPVEMRNTVEMYINNDLMKLVITNLLNNRLQEYAHDPECDYEYAGVFFDDYFVSKTKDAFYVNVIPKGDIVAAYKDAMSIVARACKTGFTNSELERVDTDIISNYEKLYNERDKTSTSTRAQEIINHFVENEPAPGIEMEYQIASGILPQIPVQAVNELASMILTPENQVIVVTEAQQPGKSLPGKAAMEATLNEVLAAEYEPYQDEVITEPLLKTTPVAGKIISENAGEYGTTVLMLSNGVKVVVKPTDFTNDQILFKAWREGGKRNYPISEADNLAMLSGAYEASRLGNYDNKTMTKYLTGKNVSLSAGVGMETFAFNGGSTVKDMPTLMELFYASMAEVSEDRQQYDIDKTQTARQFEMLANNPDFIFQKEYINTTWGNNPMMSFPSVETINKADYSQMVKMIQEATANAADYTLLFVGNVDLNTLRPLLEQYVASLPSTGKKDEVQVLTPISIPEGNLVNDFKQVVQSPIVKLYGGWDGNNVPYTIENESQLEMLGSILDNIYTMTIREEMGAAYSPQAFGRMYSSPGQWFLGYYIETNAEVCQAVIDRAVKEASDLIDNGAKSEVFNQVREAAINQLDIALRTNNYWFETLQELERGKNMIAGHEDFLKNLTLDRFNAFIKDNFKMNNSILVKMDGVVAE